jgi:hypothetical protein
MGEYKEQKVIQTISQVLEKNFNVFINVSFI